MFFCLCELDMNTTYNSERAKRAGYYVYYLNT